ncbi:MAG: aspartate/glutamate racemase family protein [Eubacteriales bacterium]|nr:aspartate/glutamate racemase family protein [Eubacteriales bacterium]
MPKYMKGRRYGYLTPTTDGGWFEGIQHQQVAGYPIGIVYIENINYPLIPGNVVNACTYDFPVRMKAVKNLTNDRLFNNDPTILDDILDAARSLVEEDGVRAICSACGFFGNYQQQVREALDVPVAMSSLVQFPWIQGLIRPGQKIGILTANKNSLNDTLLKSCGAYKTDNLIVKDGLATEEFAAVVDMRGHFDNTIAREEVVAMAKELVEEDDDIGAILLECSDMPPYAYAVQEAAQVPVFDFITLINWLHSAVAQHPYFGWV